MSSYTVADLRETGFDEVADPQATFRDLMAAFAEPARWTPVRVPRLRACPSELLPEAFFVFKTLADSLVHVWVSSELGPAVADSLRWNTGAILGPAREADYALVVPEDPIALTEFRLGNEEFPERSTLVVIQHPLPGEGDRTAVARGPGIRETVEFTVNSGVSALVDQAQTQGPFPLGVDLLLVRPGMVCALPRTLEVTWRT